MQNLKQYFAAHVENALQSLSIKEEIKSPLVSISNRPDLSDYQSNIALPLAKKCGTNPRELASKIADKLIELANDEFTVKIDGPGFINLTLTDSMLAKNVLTKAVFPKTGRTTVLDYGGPNIAKALHVGHLRPAVIGQALKQILRTYGDEVIGDVHFGDWGTPIGMLIAKMEDENIPFDTIMTMQEISDLYLRAASKFKEDEDFKEKARVATSALQSGEPSYIELWKMFRKVSVDAVKETYDRLEVDFELWLGESDVNDMLPPIFDDLMQRGFAKLDDGAIIVRLPEINGRQRAPFILKKTDGAYTYAATDLATIVYRMEHFKPDSIIYVVDARQKEHFQQVFEVARMAGYVPETTSLEHIAFGTVCGTDGKAFKTREGKAVSLSELLDIAYDKASEALPEPSDAIPAEEIAKQAEYIAYGAVKFQDLKSNYASDYIFDIDNFTKSEGKTGAYVQYAVVRINSVLNKAIENGFKIGEAINVYTPSERDILLTLSQFPEIMDKAYELREPSEITGYAHLLAQKFSSFYAECSILNESDEEKRSSRLKLISLTKTMLEECLGLVGISCPPRMLRKD